jgi:hypothetical protein
MFLFPVGYSPTIEMRPQFSGIGGRALLLLKLHNATGNASYLARAQPYVAAMEAKLASQAVEDTLSGFVGFMWSRVGMLCVSAVAADARGDGATVAARVRAVSDLVASLRGRYDDFDSGRAGLLYAVRFLEAKCASYCSHRTSQRTSHRTGHRSSHRTSHR